MLENWMEWVPKEGSYDIPNNLNSYDKIHIRLRDGLYSVSLAGDLEWNASKIEPETDIVAYRKIT